MFEDSLDPSKSNLAEFYENPHFKLVEIDMDSTSNWNTSANFLKNFIQIPLLE